METTWFAEGEEAMGESKGDKGVEEGVVLGDVGEEEEAEIEERFLLPGTAFGAEEPWTLLASLPLALAWPEAAWGCWDGAGAGGVAKQKKIFFIFFNGKGN